MYWFMREEFKEAFRRAQEISKKITPTVEKMVRTADVIRIVEEETNIDVEFEEYDFAELSDSSGKKNRFAKYGAAMYVSGNDNHQKAQIILNSRETPKMQRFSLIHELGHLILQNMEKCDGYLFSTHIDMSLPSIEDEVMLQNSFYVKEQQANIFALVVLIPPKALMEALEKHDSLDDIARLFGVEKDAIISRIKLGFHEDNS